MTGVQTCALPIYGAIQQVYCHWDGYIDHNGKILFEHYQDPLKLRELINLGDLSSLAPRIGEKHEFDCPYKYGTPEHKSWREVCTFYGRDRGDDDVSAKKFKNFADYKANHRYEQFEYILRKDGNWYVCQHGRDYELLDEVLDELEY